MEFIIIACLILLNGILAMSEIAVISSRKSKLREEAKNGSSFAQAALKLADNPDRFLSTIQVGITLIGIVTGLYSGEAFAGQLGMFLQKFGLTAGTSYVAAKVSIVICVTYVTIVFGELVPKRIGMSAAELVSKIIARPMQLLSVLGAPFIWILSKSTSAIFGLLNLGTHKTKVTEEEIKSMVQEGALGGEVLAMEQNIVERAFNLGDRDLESIMTHRVDIVWIDLGMTRDQIIELVNNHPYSKYPVADKSLDKMEGVVYLRELFGHIRDEQFTLCQYIHTAPYFHENMGVYDALEQMKDKQMQYAFVCDEFGGLTGIVSHKDILEALVGTMREPHEESEITRRQDGTWLVDGQCPFYDFLVYFHRESLYPRHEHNTVSGLLLELMKHIPTAGEYVEWQGLAFEIMDMDGTRIDKILVTSQEAVPLAEADD